MHAQTMLQKIPSFYDSALTYDVRGGGGGRASDEDDDDNNNINSNNRNYINDATAWDTYMYKAKFIAQLS